MVKLTLLEALMKTCLVNQNFITSAASSHIRCFFSKLHPFWSYNTIEMELLLLEIVHYHKKNQENRHKEAAICDCEICKLYQIPFSLEHHCFFLIKNNILPFPEEKLIRRTTSSLKKKSGNPDKSRQITPLRGRIWQNNMQAWSKYLVSVVGLA